MLVLPRTGMAVGLGDTTPARRLFAGNEKPAALSTLDGGRLSTVYTNCLNA